MAHTILPESIGDADGWPRAVVRVGILLVPALVYLGKFDQGSWANRMGLAANCRRGLVVGVAVSLVWFIPQLIARREIGQAPGDPDLTAGIWLNAIVGSPLAEELLYRQIVFRRLSERLPLWKAVGASALWFALLHLPAGLISATPPELLQYLLVISAYGVLFACLYALTQSLWAPLIPHVVNNLFYAVVAAH